jgi:lipoprotein-anchoring transpeptidase ErfK/SrfK
MIRILLTLFIAATFLSCEDSSTTTTTKKTKTYPKREKQTVTYRVDSMILWKDSLKKNPSQLLVLSAVNRTDRNHLLKMDSIIVPNDLSKPVESYLPFPLQLEFLREVDKIVYFSYPSQVFAAYENGELIYTGPTNMGRKTDPTPTGLFFTNWKAEETISTFNDEWELRWNFNIENKKGVGWHQYELPGYPASHSCLRMTEKDAKFMYEWADQWELKGTDVVLAKGTPVIVFGNYDFDGPKPWFALVENPSALDIPATYLEEQTSPYKIEILKQQQKSAKYR